MPDSLPPDLSNSERQRVFDLLWKTIALVDKGQTNYWTGEQLRMIAQMVQPPSYWPVSRPINEEASP